MTIATPARTLRALLIAVVATFCLVLPVPTAAAQTVDVAADEASVDLLLEAIDALSANDDEWLAELSETAMSGDVWLPALGIYALAERDAELLVLGAQLLEQDTTGLRDFAYDFVVYERDLMADALDGDQAAAEELTEADLEGESILEVIDRRGVDVSDDTRTVLGPLASAGGVSEASLGVYDDALDDLDTAEAGFELWIVAAAGIVLAAVVAFFLVRSRKADALANTDALTGLANRRRLENDMERRSNEQGSTAVVMIDVDHFKIFNDTHGHALGDEVLRLVGAALRDNFRDTDVPYRYGGEEFCVLLANTSSADAMHAGERARAAIAAIDVPNGLRVTASVGVALTPAPRVSEALEAADQALYLAKSNGRNRVEISSPT